jgi:endoglucanase
MRLTRTRRSGECRGLVTEPARQDKPGTRLLRSLRRLPKTRLTALGGLSKTRLTALGGLSKTRLTALRGLSKTRLLALGGLASLTAGLASWGLVSAFAASSPSTPAATSALAASSPSTPAAAGPYPHLQLRVVGNELVNASGERVVLHGVDRSGTEYKCVQGTGIFDGPTDQASINVMKSYGINAVRVPLNEACWLGESYVKPAYSGQRYRSAVEAYVQRLNASGMVAIVDLHWTDGSYLGDSSACSSAEAACQKPMPDAAEAIPFWSSVASTFKGNDAVIFDLFNEPYPEKADNGNLSEGWQCWLHGGTCAGISYPVAGMQTLVNTVRSTGANNVLMLGGLEWSNDLSGWLAHEPTDPDHNLAASWHSYNFNACSTESCWNHQIAPVMAKVPVIAGEIGEDNCSDSYVDPLTSWLNGKSASYLAWTWNTDFNCFSGPGLITGYNGAPTGFGAGYEAILRDGRSLTDLPVARDLRAAVRALRAAARDLRVR